MWVWTWTTAMPDIIGNIGVGIMGMGGTGGVGVDSLVLARVTSGLLWTREVACPQAFGAAFRGDKEALLSARWALVSVLAHADVPGRPRSPLLWLPLPPPRSLIHSSESSTVPLAVARRIGTAVPQGGAAYWYRRPSSGRSGGEGLGRISCGDAAQSAATAICPCPVSGGTSRSTRGSFSRTGRRRRPQPCPSQGRGALDRRSFS